MKHDTWGRHCLKTTQTYKAQLPTLECLPTEELSVTSQHSMWLAAIMVNPYCLSKVYMDGLTLDIGISSTLALRIPQPCITSHNSMWLWLTAIMDNSCWLSERDINGLVKDCDITGVLALEIPKSCIKPSVFFSEQGPYFVFLCLDSKFHWSLFTCDQFALVQVIAWHWTGDKPLPEPMMTQFTDICVPQGFSELTSHIKWRGYRMIFSAGILYIMGEAHILMVWSVRKRHEAFKLCLFSSTHHLSICHRNMTP